jgi:hypothetical protein
VLPHASRQPIPQLIVNVGQTVGRSMAISLNL